jgi:oligoribonuclease
MNKKPGDHVLWLDLEMTGLDPATDRILEVGAIITDWQMNEIASLETVVAQDDTVIASMTPFVRNMHSHNGLLDKMADGVPEVVAERLVVELVQKHCDTSHMVVLAGNSIHIDRGFIRQWWPRLEQLLHYRMLDVTSWKLVMEPRGIVYKKQEKHRALDDVRESMTELQFYTSHMS